MVRPSCSLKAALRCHGGSGETRQAAVPPGLPRQTRPAATTLAGMPLSNQPLIIAGRTFRSRLILGTGKFSAPEVLREALEASWAGMVTVALRRADLSGKKD